VLFGHLLRTQADDRAATILDRLEPTAVDHLVGLLDATELRLMARLVLGPARCRRFFAADGLAPSTLAALFRAAELPLAREAFAALPLERSEVLRPLLGPLARALSGPEPEPPRRRDGLLAALRLRRLFGR
jgi:hypothetical protein